ncbi:MAG: sulfatase [Planctomycetaceae bacterium]|nr:sulfatase [Planctomycetaceae bacterium]
MNRGQSEFGSLMECILNRNIAVWRTIAAPTLLLLLSIWSGDSQLQAEDSSTENSPPNILFMLVDDVGWRDLHCYGNELAVTPAIDRLAASGVRFSQAYAPAPICSASRAAVLTGRTPARLNFEFVTKESAGTQQIPGVRLRTPPYTLQLPLNEVTIAEMLQMAGYTTAFFGKWHLNAHYGRYLGWSPDFGPQAQGFQLAIEDFGGHPYGRSAAEDTRAARQLKPGEFPADSMTDHAIEFLQQQRRQQNQPPFFLMVSHFYVHVPVRSQAQWLTDQFAARKDVQSARVSPEYLAFLRIMDHQIGRLLEALEDSGMAANTLVVLLSDNGGDPKFSRHAPLRGHKWTLYEGGIRVPMLMRWPERLPAGIESPVIASGCDLLPTFAEAAGVETGALPQLDGRSLLPNLKENSAESEERPLLWHFPYYHPERDVTDLPVIAGINDPRTPFLEPHSAIRLGRWKGVFYYDRQEFELFDLQSDLSEQQNLATRHPEQAGRMRQLLHRQLMKVGARLPQRQVAGTEQWADVIVWPAVP